MIAASWSDIYNTFWGLVGVVGGIGAVAVMLWVAAHGLRERHEEVDAREFYTEHGHWPDQEPGAPPDPLPPVQQTHPAP